MWGFSCSTWDLYSRYVGSSSLSRDWTWAPFTGSSESQPLDHRDVLHEFNWEHIIGRQEIWILILPVMEPRANVLASLNRNFFRVMIIIPFSYSCSVQFSCSVISNSLQSHGLQHSRPPCPSPTPRVYSNSCPLSWWCYPTILSSVVPFSSCLQSFPASGSFQMSKFFASGGQSIIYGC